MCQHKWVDTGLPSGVTWCKYCNADAHWEAGHIVIDKVPRMSFRLYGLPISYSGINVVHGLWIEGLFGEVELEEDLKLSDYSVSDHTYGGFTQAERGVLYAGYLDRFTITLVSHSPTKLYISANAGSKTINGTIDVGETYANLIHKYFMDNLQGS